MSNLKPTVNIGDPIVKETELEGRINTETKWFNVSMFVISVAGAGLAAANAFFFDRIRKNGCGTNISVRDADVLFWINVILAVIFVILAIWALARLFLSREYRVKKTEQLKTFVSPTAPGVERTFAWQSRGTVGASAAPVEMQPIGTSTSSMDTRQPVVIGGKSVRTGSLPVREKAPVSSSPKRTVSQRTSPHRSSTVGRSTSSTRHRHSSGRGTVVSEGSPPRGR